MILMIVIAVGLAVLLFSGLRGLRGRERPVRDEATICVVEDPVDIYADAAFEQQYIKTRVELDAVDIINEMKRKRRR